MPHHLCWHCFNTAVDINAFIDSGINFQRTTVNHLFPTHYTRIKETPYNPILPVSAPDENVHEVVLQGELVEEREIVLEATGDQVGSASILAVAKEEAKLEDCYSDSQNCPDKKSEGKTDQESDGSLQYLSQVNQTSGKPEPVAVEENFQYKSQKVQKNANCDQYEKEDQHQGSKQDSEEAERPVASKEREKCSFCSKTFQRQSQLKSHLASHSEARPHQCQVCGVAFKHRRNLVEHSHTHSQQPSFICAVCGLTFKQKSK